MKKDNEINIDELLRFENPTQYQNALIFRQTFQKSNKCKKFRIAWGIPLDGFKDHQSYQAWYKKVLQETNEYYKSEKYKKQQKKLLDKRIQWAKGKITKSDLHLFGLRATFAIPLPKLTYDIDTYTIESGKPIYWRYYIEECLLFETPRLSFPTRPLPDPKLKWNFDYQFYELIIENVFPDTTTKDFDDKKFTGKLNKLQKKLLGYEEKKSRQKKSVEFGLQIINADEKKPYLSDLEKAEEITGEKYIGNKKSDLMWINKKREGDRIRQIRKRTKKYMDKSK
jgi:hypothetical protein